MLVRTVGASLLLAAISVLAACGGSTFNVQNPPPPPPQNVTITFSTPPPTGISLNASATLSATVANDPTNAGVDWALTCPSQGSFGCGSLSAAHTASGQSITFTPPVAFNGNTDAVTIVAYATATHSANVSAPIVVTAFGSVLQGTYVFQIKGTDSTFSSGYPYQLTGQVYLDGNGNIASPTGGGSAGQQTVNTFDVNSNLDSTTSQITAGTYFVGTDGRGSLIVDTTDGSGDTIEEDFSLVVNSSSQASIAQLSGTLTNSQGSTTLAQSGSGTLQLQDPSAINTLPSRGFAFVASGTDSSTTPIVYGGIINIDFPTGISGSGTLTDQGYNGAFTSCSSTKGFAGSSVSSTGTAGVINLNLVTTCTGFGPTQITGYIIDSAHIQLIETDGSFLTAGLAVGQGSATGSFTSFSGTYLFDSLGVDLTSLLPSSLTSVSVVTADTNGDITGGYTDTAFFNNADGNPALLSSQTTGTYQLDNKGIGRVHLRYMPAPAPFFDPSLVLYLTAPAGTPGAPALALYSAAANQLYPALGAGVAYPQTQPAASLSLGNGEEYSFLLTQQNGSESDGSGQLTATSMVGQGGTLSGLVDDFNNGFAVAPWAFTGAFACPQGAGSCPDSFGRFSASSFTIDGTLSAVDYFLIDQNNGFFIETDVLDSFQLTLGSFTERCDVTIAGNCQAASGNTKKHVRKKRGAK
ncbi:MAG: hypothetical protein WB817_00830 [Terriglobales bacterium]